VKLFPSLPVNDETKDPTDGENTFNNFFITVTEKLTFNK